MSIGLVGKKRGMSRRFTETGESIPVTVIEIAPNFVTQVKTAETDGYHAVQVTTGQRRAICQTKAELGHYKKANVTAGIGLWEFRVDADNQLKAGEQILVDQFSVGQIIDVTGTTKGRGFTGTVKRWNFRTQDATHGNSRSHRVPGSTGQNQSPGRTFKGKKMCGHYGNERCTIQSLEVIFIDKERNLLLVKGAVPGPQGGDVIIRRGAKAKKVKE
ncbi:MAG: 50S ribosomal protein L3 [Gammaproteobacteria bacterium]